MNSKRRINHLFIILSTIHFLYSSSQIIGGQILDTTPTITLLDALSTSLGLPPIIAEESDSSNAFSSATMRDTRLHDKTSATPHKGKNDEESPPKNKKTSATSHEDKIDEETRPKKKLLDIALSIGLLGSSDEDQGGIFSGGWATYFTQNQIPGACGKVHKDTDVIVALDYRRYGSLNKISKHCGRQVEITSGSKTINATVADACPTCLNLNCLDLSEGAFKLLGGTVEEGMKPINWTFID